MDDGRRRRLEVVFQLSSRVIELSPVTTVNILSASGTCLGPDPNLGIVWWPFICQFVLYCFGLLLWTLSHPNSDLGFAERHHGKLMVAAYLLTALARALFLWCSCLAALHLLAAVPEGLQFLRRANPTAR